MNNIIFLFVFLLNLSYISLSKVINRTNYTSFFFNSTIETVNNSNFDKIINRGMNNPYLILFTVIRCKICNYVIKEFENVQNYLIEKNSNIKLIKYDLGGNLWTMMRFDIDHIPKIIYVEKNEMSFLNNNITYDNIIDFLKNENKEKNHFPEPMTYIDFLIKIFNVFNEFLIDSSKDYGIVWNRYYTAIVIVLILILFMILEYFIIKYCCITQRKPKKKIHSHKYHKHHVHTKNDILKNKKDKIN